jgi:hypothetical protein
MDVASAPLDEAVLPHTLITVPVSFDVPSDELECSGLSAGSPHRDSGLFLAFLVASQAPDTVATVCRKVCKKSSRRCGFVFKLPLTP